MKLARINGKSAIVTPEHGCFFFTDDLAKAAGLSLLHKNNIDIAMDANLKKQLQAVMVGKKSSALAQPLGDDTPFECPVPTPPSFRDAYAFLEHVQTCRKARGQDVHLAFFECPAFYFSNPASISGSGTVKVPPHCHEKVDYELEVGIVIGQDTSDASAKEADSAIAGFMMLNDWSARKIQAERELPMMMGPNKSKDFATTCGPWLTTTDELADVADKTARGRHYDIPLEASVNGRKLSSGNLNTLHYTFAEIIAHTSAGTTLKKGDIIGSGTVGTGCLLELNLTEKTNNLWLQDGDTVILSSEKLGSLENKIKFI